MKNSKKYEERQLYLGIEKSRLNKEKSMLRLNQNFIVYITFLFIAIISFITLNISKIVINLFVIIGIIILFIGNWPYISIMKKEEKNLDNIIKKLDEEKYA